MMRRIVVGVIGGTECSERTRSQAHELGRLVAERGWVLLNGARATGVMDASARGAREAGGLTVGVLYDDDREAASSAIDITIATGMGSARNSINVLSSDVLVACCGTGGTLCEIALAVRFQRPVVLLDFDPGDSFLRAAGKGPWCHAATPVEAIQRVAAYLQDAGLSGTRTAPKG
jgi:uncharacterized protein (TIGR00725 family)